MRQRFIQSFPTSQDIQSALDNKELGKPYVALSREEPSIDWNSKEIDYTGMPLTFEIISGGTIGLMGYFNTETNYEYQINDGEIVTGQAAGNVYTNVSLNAGDKIKIRGFLNGQNGGLSVNPDADLVFNIYGNVASLGSTFVSLGLAGKHVISAENLVMLDPQFSCYHLFSGCTDLIIPPKTVISIDCRQMFYKCTSLAKAPKLPATTLANTCYADMFYGCTSLTQAPELPATTLAGSCYKTMFAGCTSLITAPELPATTLADNCYMLMFQGCTNLTKAPELPATTLTSRCYQYMFDGCTSLTRAPELPATTLVDRCYNSMFSGCTSLTQAPELPATELVSGCYQDMFRGCTNLNYVKAMFTTTPESSYTSFWLYGVASSGTFVKNPDATWDTTITRGPSTVPTNWTIENAEI